MWAVETGNPNSWKSGCDTALKRSNADVLAVQEARISSLERLDAATTEARRLGWNPVMSAALKAGGSMSSGGGGPSRPVSEGDNPRPSKRGRTDVALSESLHDAVVAGDVGAARLLLEKGADKDNATDDGSTPLLIACREQNIEFVRLLLEAGADKDKADTIRGSTPLIAACAKGNVEIVRLLVQAGADKDKGNTILGWTPLLIACRKGNVEIVRLLLEAGADKDKANNKGFSPLLVACHNGNR